MAEQNYENHTRLDPLYHFAVVPVLLLNAIVSAVRLVQRPTPDRGWNVVALAVLVLGNLVRVYALRVQDRVIRLEKRIRMAALLPMDEQMVARELTTRQVVALRFASDQELAQLAGRAVRERLTAKAIKQLIRDWRPDRLRV